MSNRKVRYEDRLNFEIVADDTVRSQKILKFILQPLVENAVLHGIEEKEGPGFVRVFAGMEQGFILLSVEDDGVGMSEEHLQKLLQNLSDNPKDDGRIGMRNVCDRIKLFYEGKGDFRIESRFREGTIRRSQLERAAQFLRMTPGCMTAAAVIMTRLPAGDLTVLPNNAMKVNCSAVPTSE